MSVQINMEMPKEPDEWIEIAIFGDGKVIQTGESWRNLENGKCYYTTTTPEKFFNAVPIPPHGRLIDADEFLKRAIGTKCFRGDYALMLEELVGESTTIIPADPEKGKMK